MNIDRDTLYVLKTYKFLRGSFYKRMRERNPIEVDWLSVDLENWEGLESFLSNYTEGQIAKSPLMSYHYSRIKRMRFELGEPVMRRDLAIWRSYILNVGVFGSPEEKAWGRGHRSPMD